jgi:Glutamine amidotransferases class-II
MCLLVARIKDSSWLPSLEEQGNAWASNPHGFGIGWLAEDGLLYTSKTLDSRDVPAMLERIPSGAPAIMHWRLATHGSKNVSNCHPWPCFNRRWVAAHNGVLSAQPCEAGLTDSQSFLNTLKGDGPNIPQVEKRIAKLGYGKFAFLSDKGRILIANESEGDWRVKGEVWQSNSALDSGFGCTGLRSKWMDDDWDKEYAAWWKPSKSVSGFAKKWDEPSVLTKLKCDWCMAESVKYSTDEGDMICGDCAKGLE